MKYDISTYSNAEVQSTTTENDITLSRDSQSIIFQMFSKNIYSNPIGSVVREITSNCFDSHMEAGVKDMPVIIRKSFDNETDTFYISFIDFGIGMSPQRINDVFSVMFSSTKRDSNDQIGAFGLGSKTPLAYKRRTGLGEGEYDNSYFITTQYDGQKYVYHVYEGNSSPKITLLHQESTIERNGTEIRIPVLKNDLIAFEREMLNQLYYFENIIFEGFDESEYVTNDYKIVNGKSFLFRGNKYSPNIHVCLGRVAYPIDYNALGLERSNYSIPLAIKLNVGDINVTVSRESLDYSEKTIKLLKEKLEEVKSEIIKMLSKQYSNITTLEDYFSAKHNFGFLKMSNGENIHIANLISTKDIDFSEFKYNHLKIPNDIQLFDLFFSRKSYGKGLPKVKWRRTEEQKFERTYQSIIDKNNIYYVDRELERKNIKQKYLSTIHQTYFIISKASLLDSMKKETLMSLFNLKIGTQLFDDNGKPSDIMSSILDMRDEYFDIIRKYCKDYHTLEVPEDFKLTRKNNTNKINISDREIVTTIIGSYYDKSKRIPLLKLIDFNNIIFYGTRNETNVLDNARNIYEDVFNGNTIYSYSEYDKRFKSNGNNVKSAIMFVSVAKNNIKYFDYCKKAYHINDFYWKMLYRKEDMILSYFNNINLINRYDYLDDLYKNPKFSLISDDWGKHIIKLNEEMAELISNKKILKLKYILNRYFNLSNPQPTNKSKKLLKLVDDLEVLQEMNKKILEYIRIDINGKYLNTQPELVQILKKTMML